MLRAPPPGGLLPLAENRTRGQSGRRSRRGRKRSLLSRLSEVARTRCTGQRTYTGLFRYGLRYPYAAARRERMTIYAENFKDEISFALGYVSSPAVYNRLFGRRTKFSSRHPWDCRATNNTELRICNQATA